MTGDDLHASIGVAFPEHPTRSLAALVTPAEAKALPIHRWFLYPHSFSPGLVSELLRAFRLGPAAIVYDPFAGAGTTLLAAQESGYSAVGADLLPLSVLVSNTKVCRYSSEGLQRSWEALQRRFCSSKEQAPGLVSDIPVLAKALPAEVMTILARLRRAIYVEESARNRQFFLVALARLVEPFSQAVKSGGWLRLIDREVDPAQVYPSYVRNVESMFGDVRQQEAAHPGGQARCYLRDATHPPRSVRFDAVITSPPYLNRHDYTRVLALEHAVLFDMRQDELIALRRRLLRSHVEARRQIRVRGYSTPAGLAEVLPALEAATHTDSRVMPMISGYFEDMFLALRALRSRVNDSGYVAFVLGDVRFAGIMVPVEPAVRSLGEQVGLRWVATWLARTRGNSAQQMKSFGREAASEYVIIWQAPRPA